MFLLFDQRSLSFLMSPLGKKIGEGQASPTKKKSKKKLILASDFEQTASGGSVVLPITLPMEKKPGTIKVKTPIKLHPSLIYSKIPLLVRLLI